MNAFNKIKQKSDALAKKARLESLEMYKKEQEGKDAVDNQVIKPFVDKILAEADENAETRVASLYEFTDSYKLADRVRDHLEGLGFRATSNFHESWWRNPDILMSSGYSVYIRW